jgi:hypothetical protein
MPNWSRSSIPWSAELDDRLPVKPGPPIVIDATSRWCATCSTCATKRCSSAYPRAILECFLLQMQRSEIKGMTPRTCAPCGAHRALSMRRSAATRPTGAVPQACSSSRT